MASYFLMYFYIFSNRRMLNIIYMFLGCKLCVRVVGCELFWSRLAGNCSGPVAEAN